VPKNTLVKCHICGKEVPMSRKGEVQKHYRGDNPAVWCKNRGKLKDGSQG